MFVVRHWHLYAITLFSGIAFILGIGVWVQNSTLENSACALKWLAGDRRFYLFLGNGDGSLHFISDSTDDVFTDCKIIGPNSTSIDVQIESFGPGFQKGVIQPPANITADTWRRMRSLLFSRTHLYRINVTSAFDGNLTIPFDAPCKKPNQ